MRRHRSSNAPRRIKEQYKSHHLHKIIFLLLVASACAEEPSRRPRTSKWSCGSAVVQASRKVGTGVLTHIPEDEKGSRLGKLWPPWPFNLIGRQPQTSSTEVGNSATSRSLLWSYFRQRASAGARQVQQVGSELWFHLPPSTPPLLLLAMIPRNNVVPAVFSNPFARNLVLASLGVSIISWAHSELNQKRRLVLLPLPEQYRDINKAFLPHFLPEEVPTLVETFSSVDDATTDPVTEKGDVLTAEMGRSPKLRKHLTDFYQSAPTPMTLRSTFRDWVRLRETRRLERARGHRATIYDELVALQALKKVSNQKKQRHQQKQPTEHDEGAMGYALVTGASRGIGRAIAVELARWEIPLILVARDVERLTSLANDIERCYGVKCIVLPADLSKGDTAEKIHDATKEAGLRVDILVNNAGISSTGPYVDMSVSDVQKIVHVNAMAVAILSNLYGRDMKEKQRGRLLMVSSVVGSVPGSPNVACYAATKAFEKVLAVSMAKEMEPFGVGVTCLMPGAVKDTSFRTRSQSDEALCWNIPFYPRTAEIVARQGVRSLLSGEVEAVPGWQNRVFLKVLQPILPPRLTTFVVETAWNPFKISFPTFGQAVKTEVENETPKVPPIMSKSDYLWPGYASRPPPRILKLSDSQIVDPSKESYVPTLSVDSFDESTIEQPARTDEVMDSAIDSRKTSEVSDQD